MTVEVTVVGVEAELGVAAETELPIGPEGLLDELDD